MRYMNFLFYEEFIFMSSQAINGFSNENGTIVTIKNFLNDLFGKGGFN